MSPLRLHFPACARARRSASLAAVLALAGCSPTVAYERLAHPSPDMSAYVSSFNEAAATSGGLTRELAAPLQTGAAWGIADLGGIVGVRFARMSGASTAVASGGSETLRLSTRSTDLTLGYPVLLVGRRHRSAFLSPPGAAVSLWATADVLLRSTRAQIESGGTSREYASHTLTGFSPGLLAVYRPSPAVGLHAGASFDWVQRIQNEMATVPTGGFFPETFRPSRQTADDAQAASGGSNGWGFRLGASVRLPGLAAGE